MTEPVRKVQVMVGVAPRAVFDVVADFAAYPRLFPEIKSARVLSVEGDRHRVEFVAALVLPVRYVLDLRVDRETPAVTWSLHESDIVIRNEGAWRFEPEGDGTRVEYRADVEVRAPLPAFVLKRVTDALVSASLPAMFTAIEREARKRAAAGR